MYTEVRLISICLIGSSSIKQCFSTIFSNPNLSTIFQLPCDCLERPRKTFEINCCQILLRFKTSGSSHTSPRFNDSTATIFQLHLLSDNYSVYYSGYFQIECPPPSSAGFVVLSTRTSCSSCPTDGRQPCLMWPLSVAMETVGGAMPLPRFVRSFCHSRGPLPSMVLTR